MPINVPKWDPDQLVKPIDLAKESGLSLSLIRKLMRNGDLSFIEVSPKVRLIEYKSVLDYLESKRR